MTKELLEALQQWSNFYSSTPHEDPKMQELIRSSVNIELYMSFRKWENINGVKEVRTATTQS